MGRVAWEGSELDGDPFDVPFRSVLFLTSCANSGDSRGERTMSDLVDSLIFCFHNSTNQRISLQTLALRWGVLNNNWGSWNSSTLTSG